MLIDETASVSTVKVHTAFSPAADDYPHYRLVSVQTEAGNDMCLLFYIDRERYLLLEPRIRRYLAVKKLARLMEKAPFKVFEVMREVK